MRVYLLEIMWIFARWPNGRWQGRHSLLHIGPSFPYTAVGGRQLWHYRSWRRELGNLVFEINARPVYYERDYFPAARSDLRYV